MNRRAGRARGSNELREAATAGGRRQSLYRKLRPGPGRGREEVAANQRSRMIAATIELAAERGYEGITVRDLVQLAGVSKASFYEQFSGKDECFVATCDTVLRAAASAVMRGESRAAAGRDRLRAGLSALAELIAAEPKGTSLVLIDGLASTPPIRAHLNQRFGLLEALVRERLTSAPRGHKLPQPLIAGIVRGIEHHARRCVRTGRPERFRGLVDPLLDWGLGFNCEKALATFAAPAPARGWVPASPPRVCAGRPRAPRDARGLCLEAAIRIAAREGYGVLTPARIRRAAGVSRRDFDRNFEDATSCFLEAVEGELDLIFAAAQRAAQAEEDWGRRTCLLSFLFGAGLAGAPDLARLAFVETADAAPASLPWRERLVASWAEVLYRGAPEGTRPSPAVAEATVAALWGFVADLVAAGRLQMLPSQAPRLSFFVLAPALGASGAAAAIDATWTAAAS